MLNKNKNYSLDDEKISTSKLMCWLSILLFFSGILLDYVSVPELIDEILILRLSMIAFLGAIIALIALYPKLYLEYYSFFIFVMFLAGSLTIQAMIYMADPTSIAHATYFAGLMLIIITVFLGTYITTFLSVFLSMSIITSFIIMSYLMQGSNILLVVNNGFFLVSALIIGVISNSLKNKFLLKILDLQNSLKENLRDQSLEVERQSQLANFDATTNIPNKRYGTKLLQKMMKNAKSLDMLVVVYFLDLNGFKKINDTYGHNAGDEVLKITADRLKNAGRKSDILFRQGGDEFVYAIMLDKEEVTLAVDFVKVIRGSITPLMKIDGLNISVNTSIGKAIFPMQGLTVSSLVQVADAKMYENKAKMASEEDQLIPSSDLPFLEDNSPGITDINSYKKNL